MVTVLFNLVNEFIVIWVGKGDLFNNYMILAMLINLYIQISRGSVDRFKDRLGIYWGVQAPVVESVVNLIISILLAYKNGIIGIFIGMIVSNCLVILMWKSYILFKEGFKINVEKYISQCLGMYS